MKNNPEHDGSALHYTALCLREMGRTEEAVADWDKLINQYQGQSLLGRRLGRDSLYRMDLFQPTQTSC